MMDQRAVLEGYAQDAAALIRPYEALRTPDVLAVVDALLPSRPSRIMDVGAGTGRDAAWLAERGHSVLAVEPVGELREAGMALHGGDRITWLDDRLPTLDRLVGKSALFDLILVIGVWQHLPPDQHREAIGALAANLAAERRIIISVRHGPGAPTRPCFPANIDSIVANAEDAGLRLRLRRSTGSLQRSNRDLGVRWTWLCFERP